MNKIGPDPESYERVLRASTPPVPDYEIDEWGYKNERVEKRRKKLGLLWFLLTLLVLLGTLILLTRFGGNNSHQVSKEWHRGAQMGEDDLARYIERHRIKTVLRLVGSDDGDKEGYEIDKAVCERLGAKCVVAKMAASRLPWRSELSTLFEALDKISAEQDQRPVLVHCRHGSDRTGLVSAIWLHDYRGAPLNEAREQLAFLPYMHVSIGEARVMGEFLDMFEAYQHTHKGAKIRDWVKTHYFEEKPGREIGKWYDGVAYAPK